MALAGSNLGIIVSATALLYAGIPLAGEAIYKVWTQESFPVSIRATVQGYINGVSRLICGLFGQSLPTIITVQNILFVLYLVIIFYKTHFRDEDFRN